MTIEQQLKLKQEVMSFYKSKFPDFPDTTKKTFTLNDIIALNFELYTYLKAELVYLLVELGPKETVVLQGSP